MDKFCLKWDDFEENIRKSFRKLREDQKLFDVTLATDDGDHIQAHKIILSAGSYFFSDMLMKSTHANILVYLKGIRKAELEPVLDFLYNGEAFIAQEELKSFIKTGKELEVKGLEGELTGVSENITEEHQIKEEPTPKIRSAFQETSYSMEPLAYPISSDNSFVKTNLPISDNSELDLQIQEMMEKNGGTWRCKICEKTDTKRHIQEHAETHIEGTSHTCYICNKTSRTRVSLRMHIQKYHKALSL